MGAGESKTSSDEELDSLSESKKGTLDDDLQDSNCLRTFGAEITENEPTAGETLDSSLKLPALFRKYLEDIRSKVNKSDEEDEDDDDDDDEDDDDEEDDDDFEYSDFLKCSPAETSACLKILIDFYFRNFDLIVFCRNAMFVMFMNSRYRIQTKTAYWTAFNDIFGRELEKIPKKSSWCEVVMFGALLAKLLVFHDPVSFALTNYMKMWMLEIIKSSAEGDETAVIAYMLVLSRLRGIINPFRGSYIQFIEVLVILLKDGDSTNRTEKVFEYLQNCSQFDDHVPLNEVIYKRETKDSKRCKRIKEFLASDDDQTFFDLNQLVFITSSEIEYFAKEFVKVSIQKPQRIKFLAVTANRMQRTIHTIRKFTTDIQRDIEDEIKNIQNNSRNSSIPIVNLSKFIGEVSIHMGLVPTELLTSWLTLLSDMGATVALVATLRINGWFYKLRQPEKFQDFQKSLGMLASEVDEEVAKVTQYFEKIGNWDTEDITAYKISRHFQPADGAKVLDDLELFVSEISNDQNVGYNYQNVYHLNAFKARKIFLREMTKPAANVIKLAQFLKSIFTLSSNIASFVRRLKLELDDKIAEMPADRPEVLTSIGKLISEMRNLTVTDKLPQEKWMYMIKSLEPENNDKILLIHLDVLKVKMYNLYMFEADGYKSCLQYVTSIETSDSQIKTKVLQITQNLIHKQISKSARNILFKIRSGWKVDSLPYDIPESSPLDFDLGDFVKLFYINATVNRYLMDNYSSSMKFLTRGSRGLKFNNLLYSLSMDRYKNMLSPDYFDDDDAVATFQFMLHFYPQNLFGQHSLTSFFEKLLAFENFDSHKNCFRILIHLIMKDSLFKQFLRNKDQDSKVFKVLRKIRVKLIDVEASAADDNKEIEVWHIVDYRGHMPDHSSSKSEAVEPSQLAWSFTENYQEIQQNSRKMLENSKEPAQEPDNLAKNFKDWTKNFHNIRHPGTSSPKFSEPDNRAINKQNSAQQGQSSRSAVLGYKILPENPQKPATVHQRPQSTSQVTTNYNQRIQRSQRFNKTLDNGWNVTRGDMKDRSDLQSADSRMFGKKE